MTPTPPSPRNVLHAAEDDDGRHGAARTVKPRDVTLPLRPWVSVEVPYDEILYDKGEDSMPAAGRMTNLHSSDYTPVAGESRATTKPSLTPHARLPVKPAANMSVADDGPPLDVVLARLLGVAVERAAALLDDYDAIAPLARVEVAELRARYGLTARQATRLKDALTLTLRLLYGSGRERPQIRSPRDVTDLMRPRLGGLPHEEMSMTTPLTGWLVPFGA